MSKLGHVIWAGLDVVALPAVAVLGVVTNENEKSKAIMHDLEKRLDAIATRPEKPEKKPETVAKPEQPVASEERHTIDIQ